MHVVIAGADQAGLQTAASLRELGFPGRISLIGDEDVLPYERPPLSKAYLRGAPGIDRVAPRNASLFVDRNIDLLLGRRVTAVDPAHPASGSVPGSCCATTGWCPRSALGRCRSPTQTSPAC